MKTPLQLSLVLALMISSLTMKAQQFEFYDLPDGHKHVPLTRFEIHSGKLFFQLQSDTPVHYSLAYYDGSGIQMTPLPAGLIPTTYHMASFRNKIFMVLEDTARSELFQPALVLYGFNGRWFDHILLPAGYTFGGFEELEEFRGRLFMGLRNIAEDRIDLFAYNGFRFNQIPLCDECYLGYNPHEEGNVFDEMIRYKGKLYIAGHYGSPTGGDYRDGLMVWDGQTVTRVPFPFDQWWTVHDNFFIYEDLLHHGGSPAWNGDSVVRPTYYRAEMTIDRDLYYWASPYGDPLGKTVYAGAVYSAPYLPFWFPEIDFLRRRLYTFSSDPQKAKEIFLPDGYYFDGIEYFHSHLQVYNCRLFMFLDNDAGFQQLVAYTDESDTECVGPRANMPEGPWTCVVYPNPGDGLFTVYFPEWLGKLSVPVIVFDDKGRAVLQKSISHNDNTIDLRSFGPGLYALRIPGGLTLRLVVR